MQSTEIFSAVQNYCESQLSFHAKKIDESDSISEEIYSDLSRLGVFAYGDPAIDEGKQDEIDRTLIVLKILEIIGRTSPAVAKAVMDQNFGQIGMIRKHGTDKCRTYIQRIKHNEGHAAFLMTEPTSGSDLRKFNTTFEAVIGGFRINGFKDWITGAERRKYFVVLAKEKGAASNFGVFLIDREEALPERILISGRKNKLGLRGLGEYYVELKDVFIPMENVVITPGSGVIKKMMGQYNLKRCGQAAISIGAAYASIREAYQYQQERFVKLGRSVFQNSQFVLAEHFTKIDSIKDLPYAAAIRTIVKNDNGAAAAMAKLIATEHATKCIDAVAQLCGANGLSDQLSFERLYRDIRMFGIAGGASEVLKENIFANMHGMIQADRDYSEWMRKN